MFQIDQTRFGERLSAGRAADEEHAKPLFEKANMLADHRRGDLKQVRGGRKGSGVSDLHEGRHAAQTVQLQTSG